MDVLLGSLGLLMFWLAVSAWFFSKLLNGEGLTRGGLIMSETKRPILSGIPLSKLPGEKRLALWKKRVSLLDEEGNEEPTLSNISSELPMSFRKDDSDE